MGTLGFVPNMEQEFLPDLGFIPRTRHQILVFSPMLSEQVEVAQSPCLTCSKKPH